jgi:hypothetical protein
MFVRSPYHCPSPATYAAFDFLFPPFSHLCPFCSSHILALYPYAFLFPWPMPCVSSPSHTLLLLESPKSVRTTTRLSMRTPRTREFLPSGTIPFLIPAWALELCARAMRRVSWSLLGPRRVWLRRVVVRRWVGGLWGVWVTETRRYRCDRREELRSFGEQCRCIVGRPAKPLYAIQRLFLHLSALSTGSYCHSVLP